MITLFCSMALFAHANTDCPAIPPTPKPSADDSTFQNNWKSVAAPYLSRYAVNADVEPNYGVGYLVIQNASEYYYDWVPRVVMPLWDTPGTGAFKGWLHSGRIHPLQSSPYALTGAGLVETEYEFSNFIIYETLESGWLRIRLAPGEEAWTHQCYLEMGLAKLQYSSWENYLHQHKEWLHFRSQVPHSLREKPDINAPRVTMIGLDHKLILHSYQGDWAYVTVEQPDSTCNGDSEQPFTGTTHQGWVKWKDDETGPWIWPYTRGC